MPNPKELRKQLRNVIQDLGPELIKSELYDAALKKVLDETFKRLSAVETHVKEVLEQLDARQKDIQSFLVRASIQQAGQAATDPLPLPSEAPIEIGETPTGQDKTT